MPTAALHPTPTPGLMQHHQHHHQQQGTGTTGSGAPQQANQPLRRAVYAHVSDLLSAYNIDHAKLEVELRRVLRTRAASSDGVPTELDTAAHHKKLQPPRGGFNLCV